MQKENVISLSAIVQNIRTTVDGGWRISLDVPQSELSAVMLLSTFRDMELALAIVPKTYGEDQGL